MEKRTYHQIHCEQKRNHVCIYTNNHGSNEHMVTDCKMVKKYLDLRRSQKDFRIY